MSRSACHFRRRLPRASAIAAACAVLIAVASGCVEREIWIVTDPPGVTVFLDGEQMEGVTEPLEDDASEPDEMRPARGRQLGVMKIPFDRYATREVVLACDGYETQTHHINPDQPLWEHFPFDFVTEVLLPSTIKLRFVFRFTMEEPEPTRVDTTFERARIVRRESAGQLADTRERYDIED